MTQRFLHISSTIDSDFEAAYLKIRQIENRVYTDEEVKRLPFSKKQKDEWALRAKSARRFKRYLDQNHRNSSLLEVGCGNGWFTHLCSTSVTMAVGVDINLQELEQAARLFGVENTQFHYWNLFESSPFNRKFNLIVLNAAVQYFDNFNALMERLKDLLVENGEIHIIDSPFYKKEDIPAAQKRTVEYYSNKAVPGMAANYYHHDLSLLTDFDELYKGRVSKIQKLLLGKDSPFSWYRYIK